MLLSVVVVNWNSRDDLRTCLASLARQTHAELEVIVVDNGSTDDSVAMVREEFPDVLLLPQDDNLGFPQACNLGIAASRGAWVCMLNNDTEADERWAEALVRAAERAPARCGMLQSLMLYQSRPNTINSTGIDISPLGSGSDRNEGKPRREGDRAEEIFCPTAGAAAYRRTMLDAIQTERGYFDRDHFLYYEDLDLGWRARLAGWTARYIPDSVVHHQWHGSSDRHDQAWLRGLARTNRVRTIVKNGSWQMLLRTAPVMTQILLERIWHDGRRGAREWRQAAREAWRLRRRVEALRTEDRRRVERTWTR